MREFTENEKKFIAKNEDKLTLKKLAQKFDCSWQEVYIAYDEITQTPWYEARIKHRTEKIKRYIEQRKKERMEARNEREKERKKVEQHIEDNEDEEGATRYLLEKLGNAYSGNGFVSSLWNRPNS